MYLDIAHASGYIECIPLRKKMEIYLVLDDIDENKEVLKKYEEVWEGIKKNWKN